MKSYQYEYEVVDTSGRKHTFVADYAAMEYHYNDGVTYKFFQNSPSGQKIVVCHFKNPQVVILHTIFEIIS